MAGMKPIDPTRTLNRVFDLAERGRLPPILLIKAACGGFWVEDIHKDMDKRIARGWKPDPEHARQLAHIEQVARKWITMARPVRPRRKSATKST